MPVNPIAVITVMSDIPSDPKHFTLSVPFSMKELVKELPGRRWLAVKKQWQVPASPSVAISIQNKFSKCRIEGDDGYKKMLEKGAGIEAAAAYKEADDLPDVPCSNTVAWAHQRRCFWFSREMVGAGLFPIMGGGKSKIAIDLLNDWQADLTLIVCPNKVRDVWPRQFALHSCRDVSTFILEGTSANRAEQAAAAVEHHRKTGRPLALIINYESSFRKDFSKWALAQEWDLVIYDEAHRIKDPGGSQSVFAAKVGKRTKHRLGLTGTPMPHSPLDVYGLYRFLDPGIFGTNFTAFRNRYAVMGGFQNHQVVRYQNEEELSEKMFSIAIEISDDVLDLPDTQDLVLECELSANARRIYSEIEDDFVTRIEEELVTVSNGLVGLLRLQQVTSGHVKTDAGEIEIIDDSKAQLFEEFLDNIPEHEPVVVFTRFTHDLQMVRDACAKKGRRYGEVSGHSNDLTKDATMPDDIDVMALQVQSGGVGIDLTRARYCVFYSLGFSLADYLQARKRVHRPGQDKPVIYYHLIAKNTKDADVYTALAKREEVVEYVIGLHRKKEDQPNEPF